VLQNILGRWTADVDEREGTRGSRRAVENSQSYYFQKEEKKGI
jgi:hypothetical protein